MKLHCWDCGGETVKGALGLGEELEKSEIYTWCPYCKKYPSDFFENKTYWRKIKENCYVMTEK